LDLTIVDNKPIITKIKSKIKIGLQLGFCWNHSSRGKVDSTVLPLSR